MKTTPLFFGDEDGLQDCVVKDRRRTKMASLPNSGFGYEVRMRRLAKNVGQVELAQLIGIHQVTLSRIETGNAPLTPQMQFRIEKALIEIEES